MRRYGLKPIYKVKYIIAENDTNKVLRIYTYDVQQTELSKIGQYAIKLKNETLNSYVLIKIY